MIPLSDATIRDTTIVCTFSEITSLKQTENRLKESEAEFKTLAQQEELLNQLSTQIRQSLHLDEILQTTVTEVRQSFQSDRALIYRFDRHWQGQVILEAVIEPWLSTLGEAADDCFPPAYIEAYQHGQVRSIPNVATAHLHPDHLQFLQRLQVQSNLIAPIIVSRQLWGLLIVHQCDQPRTWTPPEAGLIARLATQLGLAIQQADLYAQAEQNALAAKAKAEQLQRSQVELEQKSTDLERALAEQQSLELQVIQGEKMSSLGQLVAGVAHEINNPVNFIHGNLSHVKTYTKDLFGLLNLYQQYYPDPADEILTEADAIDLEFLREDFLKIVQSMTVGTDRIRQIVLSLRNFSRMDEAEFKSVDIHAGLDSTLMILHHRLKAHHDRPEITIRRDYGDLPQVDCYPGQLNQVFMNILVNAIDALDSAHQAASATAPGEISIHTESVDQTWVKIAIADNGTGIPAAVRAEIFNPFFTTKPIGKGTGMGLSISYQIIVDKHQGKLTCQSTPGQGTTFVIQIPIQPSQPSH